MSAPANLWIPRLAPLLAAAATIGCDRVTKSIATATLAGTSGHSYFGDVIRIAYTENTGGFLSLGSTLPPTMRTLVFTVGTGALLAVLSVVAVRRWRGYPLVGLALLIAGGVSNWIDRVVRGSVVDFLNVGIGPLRTGVFNVADMAIMLGVVMFVYVEVARPSARRHQSGHAATDDD